MIDFDVIKRNTDDDTDFAECRIRLQDKNLIRTIYADLYLTYYETGGWLVDYWKPYAEEIVQPLYPPNPETIRHLAEEEYTGIKPIGIDDSKLSEGIFITSYEILEKHKNVTFTGSIICTSVLSGNSAENKEKAYYYWNNELQQNVKPTWYIEGEYLLTEMDDDLPVKAYVSVDRYDPITGSIYVTAYKAWPAYDGWNYKGFYGSYVVNDNSNPYHHRLNGMNVHDASLEINLWDISTNLNFTPDEITGYVNNLDHHDFSVVRADTQKIYDEWNEFPKGTEFKFPTSR